MLIIEKRYSNYWQYSTEGLDDATLTTEREYATNFSEQQKKFCLSLHYNGEIVLKYTNTKQNILK